MKCPELKVQFLMVSFYILFQGCSASDHYWSELGVLQKGLKE